MVDTHSAFGRLVTIEKRTSFMNLPSIQEDQNVDSNLDLTMYPSPILTPSFLPPMTQCHNFGIYHSLASFEVRVGHGSPHIPPQHSIVSHPTS